MRAGLTESWSDKEWWLCLKKWPQSCSEWGQGNCEGSSRKTKYTLPITERTGGHFPSTFSCSQMNTTQVTFSQNYAENVQICWIWECFPVPHQKNKSSDGKGEKREDSAQPHEPRESGIGRVPTLHHSSPGRSFLYWNLWIMPLIYDTPPLPNVEKNGTLKCLIGEFSQSVSSPFLNFPCVF